MGGGLANSGPPGRTELLLVGLGLVVAGLKLLVAGSLDVLPGIGGRFVEVFGAGETTICSPRTGGRPGSFNIRSGSDGALSLGRAGRPGSPPSVLNGV